VFVQARVSVVDDFCCIVLAADTKYLASCSDGSQLWLSSGHEQPLANNKLTIRTNPICQHCKRINASMPVPQSHSAVGGLPSVNSLATELSKSLEQVREFARTQRARVSRASSEHVSAIDEFTEQIANAREMEHMAADQRVLNSQALNEVRASLEKMRAELTELKHKEDEFPALEEEHNAKLVKMREELSRQQAELHECMTRDQQTLDDLTMAMERYQKFGLSFSRLEDNVVEFSFQYIDPNEPEKRFQFVLHVDDTNAYHVTKCTPALVRVDSLVDTLNRTNDFSAFVAAMRRQFQATVPST
jgi:kinetochore protein Spc25